MENLKIDDDDSILEEYSTWSVGRDESYELASTPNDTSIWQKPISENESRVVYDMFALSDKPKSYDHLDKCIDESRESELYSISQLIRGQTLQRRSRRLLIFVQLLWSGSIPD